VRNIPFSLSLSLSLSLCNCCGELRPSGASGTPFPRTLRFFRIALMRSSSKPFGSMKLIALSILGEGIPCVGLSGGGGGALSRSSPIEESRNARVDQ